MSFKRLLLPSLATAHGRMLLQVGGVVTCIQLASVALADEAYVVEVDAADSEDTGVRQDMEKLILSVQNDICEALEDVDGGTFHEDTWIRAKNGGGGRTRVLQDGKVFEKAGVNVSIVKGNLSKGAIAQMKSRGKEIFGTDAPFYACGISLVLHPHNPMAPTVHANFRYFEVQSRNSEDRLVKHAWFGGGADLTPAYLFEEDAVHFHKTWKQVCDKHDKTLYPKYKKWCDDYFNLTHRKERRGVGGIFFDDVETTDMREAFKFVSDAAHAFLPAYMPIIRKRKDMAYTEEQRHWQQIRRSRYVEFNLVHDRGTKFGLAMPGSRIESILVSMPLTARWEYCHEPEVGSPEAQLVQVLRKPVEWVSEE